MVVGHIANAKEEIYRALAERLNKNPAGAPVNEALMGILHQLYTESEAEVGSKFPLVPMTLRRISGVTGIEEAELEVILNGMADKGLIIDIPRKDSVFYMLAPMVVGFFEYTFMRTGNSVHLKELAELFETYFQSDGVREEISGIDTKMMRTLVYESIIPLAVDTEVLSYERASEIIRQSGGGAISMCACRHKASHLGKACDAPMDVCTSLGEAAEWIIRRGLGRPATVDELLNVLKETQERGLVHLCDNVLNQPTYICHCCGCCCQVLTSIRTKEVSATQPSNFFPSIESENCINCGICVDQCPLHALIMTDLGEGNEVPVVKDQVCIGCGVCASSCPTESMTMSRRSLLSVPPENAREKFKRMLKEKGR